MSKMVPFAVIERDSRLLRFSLEREWSCPIHDDEPDRWDDDGDYLDDDEISCNGCRGAGWKIAYAPDGSVTMTVAEVGAWEQMLRQMRGPLIESLTVTEPLLAELNKSPDIEYGGVKLLYPIMPASTTNTLPTS